MSTYYNFYVAIREKETGKVVHFPGLTHTVKPDKEEDTLELKTVMNCILYRTGSFMPEGYIDDWYHLNKTDVDDVIKETFTGTDWRGETSFADVNLISLSDLRKLGLDFIKKGYYLVDEIDEYENSEYKDTEGIFYNPISAVSYANMCAKKIKTTTAKDEEGYEYTKHGYEDYSYYAFPDYNSKEYLNFELSTLGSSFEDMLYYLYNWEDRNKYEIVILEECDY